MLNLLQQFSSSLSAILFNQNNTTPGQLKAETSGRYCRVSKYSNNILLISNTIVNERQKPTG